MKHECITSVVPQSLQISKDWNSWGRFGVSVRAVLAHPSPAPAVTSLHWGNNGVIYEQTQSAGKDVVFLSEGFAGGLIYCGHYCGSVGDSVPGGK